MAKYHIGFWTGAHTSIEVEAENEDEAWDKAWREFSPPTICAYCSKDIELSGDWDIDDSTGYLVDED